MFTGAMALLGPTASGKTALALQLAEKIPLEIISLDSALVYTGMDIGTAKPTVEERAAAVHHLIDIRDPAQSYSAAEFRQDCLKLVPEILARGHLPLICGGTMMYYKALTSGLSPLPPTDPEVRAAVAAKAQKLGWPALHAELKTKDPILYHKLSPNDKQRVSRALEIIAMTGKAPSSFYAKSGSACPFAVQAWVLMPDQDRARLRIKIEQRFAAMLQAGLIDEVECLKRRGDLNLDLPSMRSVGYRQVWEYLDGKLSLQEMQERAVIATAHLAKHQMTWLRGGLKQTVFKLLPMDSHDRLQQLYAAALKLRQA